MLLAYLEREEAATGRQRPREPDAAVARQRADLEDFARATGRRQHLEQPPLQRRDRDRRHAARSRRLLRAAQRLIFGREKRHQLAVYERAPLRLLAQLSD